MKSVYWAVRTGSLNIILFNFNPYNAEGQFIIIIIITIIINAPEGLGILACSSILKMKLVPPSLPRSSYVSSFVCIIIIIIIIVKWIMYGDKLRRILCDLALLCKTHIFMKPS